MPGSPFWGEGVEWVGLTHFKRFVEGKYFGRLIKNTLVLSGMNLLFGFTAPILFALLIDQIKRLRFKKIAQTASYMPYFISTVVVAGMVISFIDQGGLISNFLSAVFGLPNQNWRDQAPAFLQFIRSQMSGKDSALAVFCIFLRSHRSIRASMSRQELTGQTEDSSAGTSHYLELKILLRLT